MTLKERFHELYDKWVDETRYFSIMSKKLENEHFQDMVNLGWDIVPYILEQTRKDVDNNMGNFLFLVLLKITGVNPLYPEDRGSIRAINERWLEWGRTDFITKSPYFKSDDERIEYKLSMKH